MEIEEIHDNTADFKFIPPFELPDGFVVRSLEHALATHSAIRHGAPQMAGMIEEQLVTATRRYFQQPHDRALVLSGAMDFKPQVQVTRVK